jgi:Predicted membrane protein
MEQKKISRVILNWFIAILKGTLVGLAIVIPGVSGGSMLLTIGVYSDAVSITSKNKETRKAAILKLIPYAIGIVLGVAVLSFVITWLLANWELYTILVFCGLILGSLPMLIRGIKGQMNVRKASPFCLILTALMIALMIALPLLNNRTVEDFEHLTKEDNIVLNDRIVLIEDGSAPVSDRISLKKNSIEIPILKVKSSLGGLAGMRGDITDGAVLEYEALDDTNWTDDPVALVWNSDDTMTIRGTSYTVYRAVDTLSNGIVSAVWAGILGFIAAGTMIIPGISGSMVLLVLGYYNSVMSHLKGAIVAALTLSFASLFRHMLVLVPFGIGIILGLLIVSKAVKWLLDKHPAPTYYAIIGLMLASPFAIFMKSSLLNETFLSSMHWYTVVIGFACLALGFFTAIKLSKGEK